MAKWIVPVATAALLIGCGSMPPPTPWDGSREDTLAIKNLITQLRAQAETHWFFDPGFVLEPDLVPVSIPASIISKFKADTFSQDFFPVAFQRVATEIDTVDSLVFSKDSTCTVSIIMRVKQGVFTVKCDSVTPVKDTIMMGGKPTIVYSNQFVPADTFLAKDLHGESWQMAFFTYDTVARDWRFDKVSGGMQFWFPTVAGAPFIYPSISFTQGLEQDTVFLRPDSAHIGLQGLYPVDSLLSYQTGDTVFFQNVFTGFVYADSVLFLWSDSTRVASSTPVRLTTPGTHMISFEMANAEPFISPKATSTYRSIIWGVPVQVK